MHKMAFEYLKELISASSVTTVSTLLVLVFGILYFLVKGRNLPPGPIGLPFLGYWPFLRDEDVHFHFTDLMKKYGDVYSFTITGKLYIHLGSIKSMKEAYLTKGDCFMDRYTNYSIFSIIYGKGIAGVNGEEWKVLQKFFVQAFKEYGLTSVKDYMAGPIYDSVSACVDYIKAMNGSPFNIVSILNDQSSIIFRRMMFNNDEITDEELGGVLESYQNALTLFTGRRMLLAGEFARYFIFPTFKGYSFSLENHKKMQEILAKVIRRHEKTYNAGNMRDIIDSYIKERNERCEKHDPSAEYFSDDALISSLIQFIGDGILGIAVFIAYFIHALLEYPEEQEKIYKELEDVIGPDRPIAMEDRSKLSYTNAFLQEVMRTADYYPIFPTLECSKETTLNGYRIPKGAITVMNVWSAHRDPSVFDDPDKFNPSRYISEPGKSKAEAPVRFEMGKRSCSGEPFIMMQVFLFLTTIVKNFKLERLKENVKEFFMNGQMEVYAHPRK